VVQTGGAPLPTLTLRIGSKAFEIQKHAVPGRFVEGLKTLHEHPHSLRLPYLYQTFLELCGGFVFMKSDDDLVMLESITGVPKSDIVPAIRLLDEFVAPPGNSMFYEVKGQLLCFKMVPGFVRAMGSLRRLKYFAFEDYDKKYPDVGWLLRKWHTAGYKVLVTELPETVT
jgi:hypothetical protein